MARMCGKETAGGLPCVFEGDHDPPCMDVRGKRHFVLKAELGALRGLPPHLVGHAGLNVPPGARFMVNVGGGRAQAIFTLEEVLNEKQKEMERDRLLATTIAAWAYATGQGRHGPARGVAPVQAALDELKGQLEQAQKNFDGLHKAALAAVLSLRSKSMRDGRRVTSWEKLNTPALVELAETLWPRDVYMKNLNLSPEDLEKLRQVKGEILADPIGELIEPPSPTPPERLRLFFVVSEEGCCPVEAVDKEAALAAFKVKWDRADDCEDCSVHDVTVNDLDELLDGFERRSSDFKPGRVETVKERT